MGIEENPKRLSAFGAAGRIGGPALLATDQLAVVATGIAAVTMGADYSQRQ
jgi:hypothetical protein